MWPDRRIFKLFNIELPIIQAPMAGPVFSDMVIAVAEAGGLGSLPCATMDAPQIRQELRTIREGTDKPINVNFFCHRPPDADALREAHWQEQLKPITLNWGLILKRLCLRPIARHSMMNYVGW